LAVDAKGAAVGSSTPDKVDAPKTDGETKAIGGDEARAQATLLTRSETPLAVKVSVERNPGFRLEPLTAMYALAGAAVRPSYALPFADAPPGAASAAYDGDLSTAAICTQGQEDDRRCAIGLSLPSDSKVTMLRVFFAAGPDYRDYTGAARPKKIAVHTDAGRVELDYPDGAVHRYIVFDEPVATAGLSVEVLDVTPGRNKGTELHFAEIEAYGVEGAHREAATLEPRQTFVYFETQPWKDKGAGEHTVKMTWLEHLAYKGVDTPSVRSRWIRGVAAYGDDSDRLMLIEKGLSSTCEAPEVSYVLIDKETRMIYPLGELAGGGATIYRRRDGLGFVAIPGGDNDEARVSGMRSITFDPASSSFDRRRGKKKWTVADHLREWDLVEARRPGGVELETYVADPTSHCSVASGESRAPARELSEVFSTEEPGEWWECNVGDGHHMLIGRDSACGEAVSIILRTSEGEHHLRADFPAGAGPRRLAVEPNPRFPGVIVEVGKESGAASDLVPVNIDLIDEAILRDASLAVRPPAACGACLLDYGRPSADSSGSL